MDFKSKSFDYSKDFSSLDFRKHPELYEIGRGEQGVLSVEPYKSEILPYWKFKNPEVALKSAKSIYKLFTAYKKSNDFVGMDMSRKFLQMGFTRARRYANHSSGKKYSTAKEEQEKGAKKVLPQAEDWATNEKAESAKIFYSWYVKAKTDKKYLLMKTEHMRKAKNVSV